MKSFKILTAEDMTTLKGIEQNVKSKPYSWAGNGSADPHGKLGNSLFKQCTFKIIRTAAKHRKSKVSRFSAQKSLRAHKHEISASV